MVDENTIWYDKLLQDLMEKYGEDTKLAASFKEGAEEDIKTSGITTS